MKPLPAIIACIALLGLTGCIRPTYNIYIGGDHKHDEAKQPALEPDSRVDEVRRILDVGSD